MRQSWRSAYPSSAWWTNTPTTTRASVGPSPPDRGRWLPASVVNCSKNCYTEFKNSLRETRSRNNLFMLEPNSICSLKFYLYRKLWKCPSLWFFIQIPPSISLYLFKYYSYRVWEHRKWIWITDWFRKIKSMDSNIKERIINRPIFSKAKI